MSNYTLLAVLVGANRCVATCFKLYLGLSSYHATAQLPLGRRELDWKFAFTMNIVLCYKSNGLGNIVAISCLVLPALAVVAVERVGGQAIHWTEPDVHLYPLLCYR